MEEAVSTELEHVATTLDQNDSRVNVEKTETLALENDYRTTMETYLVLVLSGLTWGTCTLAEVGPSSTYSDAVEELADAECCSVFINRVAAILGATSPGFA